MQVVTSLTLEQFLEFVLSILKNQISISLSAACHPFLNKLVILTEHSRFSFSFCFLLCSIWSGGNANTTKGPL